MIAAASITLIVAGATYIIRGGTSDGDFDAKFFGLVGAAILPAVVYLVGVHRRRSALIYGLAILGVNFVGWIFTFSDDGMRAVGTVPAFFVTLAISIAGVVNDRRPQGSGELPRQTLS